MKDKQLEQIPYSLSLQPLLPLSPPAPAPAPVPSTNALPQTPHPLLPIPATTTTNPSIRLHEENQSSDDTIINSSTGAAMVSRKEMEMSPFTPGEEEEILRILQMSLAWLLELRRPVSERVWASSSASCGD